MNTRDLVSSTLKALTSQVGSADKVLKLPSDTIITAIAHTDDVLGINIDSWVIEISNMDLNYGYEVYNRDYELLYNETADLGLANRAWGTTDRDIYLLWVLKYGEYVYLTYRLTGDTEVRTLMLIKF